MILNRSVLLGLKMGFGIIQYFSHLSGFSFEDFFTTSKQDHYALVCSVDAYDKFHPENYDYVVSGGEILLPDD